MSGNAPSGSISTRTTSGCRATRTTWRRAPVSQMFMLVGTLILLPIILGYTALVYWVFRGKVHEGERYH